MPHRDDFVERDETTDPHNPPEAVVNRTARSAALVTFLGGIVLVFLLVAAVLLFWKATDRPGTPGDRSVVGTAGERNDTTGERTRERTPGGFEPAPGHDNTRGELEFRGVNEPATGPNPALTGADAKQKDERSEKK
jgi:hypothetical protein